MVFHFKSVFQLTRFAENALKLEIFLSTQDDSGFFFIFPAGISKVCVRIDPEAKTMVPRVPDLMPLFHDRMTYTLGLCA